MDMSVLFRILYTMCIISYFIHNVYNFVFVWSKLPRFEQINWWKSDIELSKWTRTRISSLFVIYNVSKCVQIKTFNFDPCGKHIQWNVYWTRKMQVEYFSLTRNVLWYCLQIGVHWWFVYNFVVAYLGYILAYSWLNKVVFSNITLHLVSTC